jgi:hypothetical protein
MHEQARLSGGGGAPGAIRNRRPVSILASLQQLGLKLETQKTDVFTKLKTIS